MAASARLACVAIVSLAGTPLSHAHDFWLQPQEFRIGASTPLPFTLQVGHGPLRQRSPIPMRRVERLDAIAPDGSVEEMRSHLRIGGDADDGDVAFDRDGTYLLVLQTDDRAESHLPAIRFNDYLRAEGLAPALALREHTHRMQTDGSENYRRIAKAIVQVGDASADAQITRALGLQLEIVPERSPLAMPRAATLPVRVYYEQRPLAGALVKLTDLGNDAEPLETHVTNDEGRAEFTLPEKGAWLLNVIWTTAKPEGSDTDFETVFSSLSFGMPD